MNRLMYGAVPRTDRRRARHLGEAYQFEVQGKHVIVLMDVGSVQVGEPSTLEVQDADFFGRFAGPSIAKQVYLEAMPEIEPAGRVERIVELEYKPPFGAVIPLTGTGPRILEEFEGFVDKIDGDVAHVTLTALSGEKLYGEYPVAELNAHGIRERRRFKCRTVEVGTSVEFVIEPIPDRELSEERERQIDAWLRESLGDDDNALQDDY